MLKKSTNVHLSSLSTVLVFLLMVFVVGFVVDRFPILQRQHAHLRRSAGVFWDGVNVAVGHSQCSTSLQNQGQGLPHPTPSSCFCESLLSDYSSFAFQIILSALPLNNNDELTIHGLLPQGGKASMDYYQEDRHAHLSNLFCIFGKSDKKVHYFSLCGGGTRNMEDEWRFPGVERILLQCTNFYVIIGLWCLYLQ